MRHWLAVPSHGSPDGSSGSAFHIEVELRDRKPTLELSGDFAAVPEADADLDKVLHQLDTIPAPLHVRTASLLASSPATLARLLAAAARRTPAAPLILDQIGPPLLGLLGRLGLSTIVPVNLTAEIQRRKDDPD